MARKEAPKQAKLLSLTHISHKNISSNEVNTQLRVNIHPSQPPHFFLINKVAALPNWVVQNSLKTLLKAS